MKLDELWSLAASPKPFPFKAMTASIGTPDMNPPRDDISGLPDKAVKIARAQVIDPALNAIRHTRETLVKRASEVEHYSAEQCARIARQISANPFTSVTIAFAAGWLTGIMCGLGSSKHA
jgi:ElaB/YqjD/DUF883 family membrane-anchored ribosome-binding protein